MSHDAVVIVGGGQGGFQTAASLRQDGFAGRIALVCDEAVLPYQRPPLSKGYLLGSVGPDGLLFRPEPFFAENRIEIVRGRMEAIDRTNRRVVLGGGVSLPYDHLVLAVGAHNRRLPVDGADLDGVLGLRTQGEADTVRARLADVRDVVVVGAGFIGLEFAAVARSLGKSVHVLELADRPMARALSPEMSAVFLREHRAAGIHLDLGQGLSRIHGRRGRVSAVETTDGRILPADLVMVGIGILPNVAAASEAGLAVANGIVVDDHLLTRDPAISAIGDCAAFPSPVSGDPVRLESVQNAADQARTVAARLTNRARPYAAVPWFWSDQGALKLQIAGLTAGHDTTISVGDPGARALSVFCFRGGRLLGVEALNRPTDYMAARRVLARPDLDLTPAMAEAAGFDLKTWEARTRS